MAQETAVQWLLEVKKKWGNILLTDLEQAKAMEKEQIKEDFIAGEMNNDSHHYTGRKIYQDETDYYNKTYNK